MDNFCRAHKDNHLNKYCPAFINDSWEEFLSQNQFGIQITHTRVIPRPVSPDKEDANEGFSDEDDLPLIEVIAL